MNCFPRGSIEELGVNKVEMMEQRIRWFLVGRAWHGNCICASDIRHQTSQPSLVFQLIDTPSDDPIPSEIEYFRRRPFVISRVFLAPPFPPTLRTTSRPSPLKPLQNAALSRSPDVSTYWSHDEGGSSSFPAFPYSPGIC